MGWGRRGFGGMRSAARRALGRPASHKTFGGAWRTPAAVAADAAAAEPAEPAAPAPVARVKPPLPQWRPGMSLADYFRALVQARGVSHFDLK